MSYFQNQNGTDIFLWADGYWCFREDFHTQPRHTYTYRLVLANSAQWDDITGAELYSRSSRRLPNRNPPQSPTQQRR